MSDVNEAWRKAQRARWLRPNGHLYVRADAWRLAPPGTPEAKPPGWLDPSMTRVRWKEAQEEEARAHEAARQEELQRELLDIRREVKELERELAARRAAWERADEAARIKCDIAWDRFVGTFERYAAQQKAGFNPDQPRDEQGRWTSEGGSVGDEAAADSSDDAVPTTGGLVRVAQLAVPGDTLSDANNSPFGADKPGWHDYKQGPTLACSAELRCSREEITDQLSRYSLPGRDPSMPVRDEGTYPVHIPGTDIYVGDVRTRITEDGLTIENRTREGHIFLDGVIVRRLMQSDDGARYVTTHGFGNNVIPGTNVVNQLVGPEVFAELDRQMRANIERHHAKGAVLDLPIHRMDGGGRHGAGAAVLGARHEIA